MKPGRAALWIALIGLLASPGVSASHGHLDASADLPLQASGQYEVTATKTHFLMEGVTGKVALKLDDLTGQVEKVTHRAFSYLNVDEPRAGVFWHHQNKVEKWDVNQASLRLDERHEEFRFLASSDRTSLQNGQLARDFFLGTSAESLTIRSEMEHDGVMVVKVHDVAPHEFVATIPSGLYEGQTTSGKLLSEGKSTLYMTGGVFLLNLEDGKEHRFESFSRTETHPGTFYDPVNKVWLGGGEHEEYVFEYLTMRLEEGTIAASFDGIPGHIFDGSPTLAITGEALLPAATGTVIVHDEGKEIIHELNGEDLTLGGQFTLEPRWISREDGRTTVTGEGDFTSVAFGTTLAQYDWASTLKAVGIGAVILAGLATIGAALKGLASGGLLAGYARVQGPAVLQHPGRSQVYDLVKGSPGVHFMDLADQVPFGWSTLNYHLRVLEKNEIIFRIKDGRYARFFDRQSGTYANGRKELVAALKNDTTAAIAKHIVRHPGIAQCDIAEKFGIAASTVSWHIRRLHGAGLVDKQRDRHYTRYYMGESWAKLPESELRRLGVSHT